MTAVPRIIIAAVPSGRRSHPRLASHPTTPADRMNPTRYPPVAPVAAAQPWPPSL